MSRIELEMNAFWAVPIVRVQYPEPAALCAELTELLLRREAEGERYRNRIRRDTQQGIFESSFDLHRWPDPPVQSLFGFLHTALATTVQQLNGYSREVLAAIRFDYHSWFHVTRQGGHQTTHHHPNASWSGIFCVDPGDASDSFPLSGTVRFVDPRAGAGMYQDPANENLHERYRFASITHRHEAGLLVMFPSYLFHEVLAYQGSRPRIVVAFNAWCWMAGQKGAGPARGTAAG